MPEKVRLVDDSTALLSLRESDFDIYSAYGEVIDNSIQANASFMRIRLTSGQSTRKGGFEPILEVAFGDDGSGMDKDILQRCLQLGYSTRYNDRSGIGRFGVGMTLAAINQCQCIEIYSKSCSGDWLWTYIDIEEFSAEKKDSAAISEPIKKLPPSKYQRLVGEQQGTLVIWKKYDRQPESAHKIVPQMKEWLGRTYRYFIWDDDFTIEVNDEEVKAIDPLYIRWEKTKFPNDPPGEENEPIKFNWPVSEDLHERYGKTESEITIRMGLVNSYLRPNQGAGNASQVKDRYIPDNEGISILRNRREVFYGHVPYWPGKSSWFAEIDRWWGCEVHFGPLLDKAFTVKNIKRGAIPVKELKRTIYENIKPTRDSYLEKVRDLWAQNKKQRQEQERSKFGEETGHEDAERIAKDTPTDTSLLDRGKDKDAEVDKLVERICRESDEEQKAVLAAKWKNQPFTIQEDSWRGVEFFETNHLGGSDVIRYNRQHSFIEEIYKVIEHLEINTTDSENALKLKQLIDLLLIAYSKAEAKFEGDMEIRVDDFIEQMRMNWGSYLKSYLRTWKKDNEE